VDYTLLYATLRYSTLLYATLRYSTLFYATLRYSTLLYATLLYATLLYAVWNRRRKISDFFCYRQFINRRPNKINFSTQNSEANTAFDPMSMTSGLSR
jgi:hypothetical protein